MTWKIRAGCFKGCPPLIRSKSCLFRESVVTVDDDKRRYQSIIELQCVSEVVVVIDSEIYNLQLKIIFKSRQKNLENFLHFSFVMYVQGSRFMSRYVPPVQ